ncbi:large ribosomal subunit protein mL50-like isoform 2-T3 [Cyanocitta cristata]
MAALRAARQRLPGLGPAGPRAFWGGRRKEEKEEEADGAAPEKEERSEHSRSCLPPESLQSCLESHVREVFGPGVPEDWQQTPLRETRLKHRLLARLAAELGHAVPNSRLQQLRRAGDVLRFYRSPAKDGTKVEELAAAELPPNLKIIWQQ